MQSAEGVAAQPDDGLQREPVTQETPLPGRDETRAELVRALAWEAATGYGSKASFEIDRGYSF